MVYKEERIAGNNYFVCFICCLALKTSSLSDAELKYHIHPCLSPCFESTELSPRISALYNTSHVVIKESNDPYGMLSLDEVADAVEEKDQDVTITIRRSGISLAKLLYIALT